MTLWTAFFGVPAAFISVVDISPVSKVASLLAFAVTATLMTSPVVILLRERGRIDRLSRRSRVRLAVQMCSAVASIIAAIIAATVIQERVTEALQTACVAVGNGQPAFAEAFQQAYEDHGGESRLGCARTPVAFWAGGYVQYLSGPTGRIAITATSPEVAYVLEEDELNGLESIAGYGQSLAVAGYPYGEVSDLENGRLLELGAGGQWERSAIVQRDGSEWWWVQSDLWERYEGEFSGPEGELGYPTSGAEPWNDAIRQEFEHGALIYNAERGVLTEEEYATGESRRRPVDTEAGVSSPSVLTDRWQLNPGQRLGVGQNLTSPNGHFRLEFSDDGNLVLRSENDDDPLWQTRTSEPGAVLSMERDGNLILVDGENSTTIWQTDTYEPGTILRIQDDGNLVLVAPGNQPVWDSGTAE